MEDKESLARKQNELLSQHLSSVGGYPATSPTGASLSTSNLSQSSTPAHSPQPSPRLNGYDQMMPPQTSQTPQYPQTLTPMQTQGLLQQQQLQQQEFLARQKQQGGRPLDGSYSPRYGARPLPMMYRGLSNSGQLFSAMNGPMGQMPPLGRGGSPVMKSSSMTVTGPSLEGGASPGYQRPQYQRPYQDKDYQLYEKFEQQAHYYRDVGPSADLQALQQQQQQQQQHTQPYAPYRHSTYHGVYAGSPQSQRQQQATQLQAQHSLNLGPMPQNRFPIARDQLPTAPSPSVFSATQPEPVYPEQPQQIESSTSGVEVGNPTPESSQPKDSFIAPHPNRNSTYSMYSAGSPIIPDRIPRPMSAVIEPTAQYPRSPRMNHLLNGNNSIARSGSDPNWSTSSTVVSSAPRPKSSQALSYSRQVTLSTIPTHEEVPPMPGKMTSKTGKVRIQLTFDRPFFNAGGELSGRLEVQCSSSRSVMLADMIIELLGYEALTKDHLTPKIFHKTILRLQDARHPSQAVQENIDPDGEGYWLARKGRTIFPFRLNVQDTLPNSYDSKLGQVRYVASAIATLKANHHKEVVNHTREVFIYETWTTDDITQARRKSVKADTSKRLFMGGEGSLEMYAELTRTMVSSGGIVYVNVGVKNLTKKKIMGIKLSLWRHIAASHSRASISSQSSGMGIREQDSVKNYSEIIYKGEDYAFDSDDPRIVVLPVYIPSGVYSLRNTSYLHVQFFVQVSLMASMSKALAVELPIYITHASSWSDPPPRIPKDFTFPLHEDDPVKKKKTGVFSKKKPSAINTQPNGLGSPTISPRKPGAAGTVMSVSAPTSKSNTPRPPDTIANGARPITHRSPLKDPDSPTSVLDFSQAGNLFVVNPDTSSVNGSDISSVMRQPLATRAAPAPRVLSLDESSFSSPPSSSPVDRSTPLMPIDQGLVTTTDSQAEDNRDEPLEDEEQDFDMSRSVSSSISQQPTTNKREHEKSKHCKMGLRKTLAKLSIAIPSHSAIHCSSGSKASRRSPSRMSPSRLSPSRMSPSRLSPSRLSPLVLPSTPRSVKSLSMVSSDDPVSAGSHRSLEDSRSLSRQSSGSSMGSFTAMFERHTRKPSGGSNRVMTASPGPVSPDSRSIGSEHNSATPLTYNSKASSGSLSELSSPAVWSGPSSADARDEQTTRHRDPGQLSMTPSIPDLRLHQGTPLMEEMGREEYFEENDAGRSSTPSPEENGIPIAQSSPSTPNSQTKPWELPRKFSSSSLASSVLDPMEGSIQTARSIRDQFYYSSALVRSPSASSFEIRMDERSQTTYIGESKNGSSDMRDGAAPARERQPSQQDIFDRFTQDDELRDNPPVRQFQQGEEEEGQKRLHELFVRQEEEQRRLQGRQTQHHVQLQMQQDLHNHQQQQQQQQWTAGYGDISQSVSTQYSDPGVVVAPRSAPLVLDAYSAMSPLVQALPEHLQAPVPSLGPAPEFDTMDQYRTADEFQMQLNRESLSRHSSRPPSRQSSGHNSHIQMAGDPSTSSPLQHEFGQAQYFSPSRPSSPLAGLGNGYNDNTFSGMPAPSAHTAQQPQQQPDHSPHGFSPAVYSAPMIRQDEGGLMTRAIMLEQHTNGTIPAQFLPSALQTEPVAATLHGDPQDLSHSNAGDGRYGAPGGLSLMEQTFVPPPAMEDNVMVYPGSMNPRQENSQYMGATLQTTQFSPHPSRSNSRQNSPKQWHQDVFVQSAHPQGQVVPPYDQRESDPNIHMVAYSGGGQDFQPLKTVPLSYAGHTYPVSGGLTDPAFDQQSIIRQEDPPMSIPYDNRPLQGSIYMEDTQHAPYQPRTQYIPASASALNNESRVNSAEELGGSASYYQTAPEPAHALVPESYLRSSEILQAPPLIPQASWTHHSSPPLPSRELEPVVMSHMESSAPIFQQQNPYMVKAQPSTVPAPEDIRAFAEGEPSLQQQQVQHSESLTSSTSPGGGRQIVRSESLRLSGSSQGPNYRMSPLAYEGNVMTASSPPPPSDGGVEVFSGLDPAPPVDPQQPHDQGQISPAPSLAEEGKVDEREALPPQMTASFESAHTTQPQDFYSHQTDHNAKVRGLNVMNPDP